MNYQRYTAIFFRNSNKYFLTFIGLFFTASKFVYDFWKDNPDSLFLGIKKLSLYNVINFTFSTVVVITVVWAIVWLYVRNSPPTVNIKPTSPLGNRKFAYIEIQNSEPHGIKSIRLKLLSLKDKDGINRISHFGKRTDIKKVIDSSKNQKVEIPVCEGNDGAVWVLVDKRPEALMARNQYENYEIVFDLYAEPNKEGQELFVGTYSGKFRHDKLIDVNQDVISWMIKDFVKINKKSVLQS